MAAPASPPLPSHPIAAARPHPPISILKRPAADLPLSSTSYRRKTARGKVLSVLREKYLREDIPCGYEACRLCEGFEGYRPVLPERGWAHGRFGLGGEGGEGRGCWVVLDTNIALHQVSLAPLRR